LTAITVAGEFVDAILGGRKITTIRSGLRRYLLGPAVMRSGAVQIPINITEVRFKAFGELTETDALRDGLESLEHLRSVLLRFYPDLSESDTLTVVEFRTK
jgi:hypothetical protein